MWSYLSDDMYDKLIWNLDKYIRQLMKIHLDKYFFQLGQMHFTKRTTNFCETKGCMWFELSDDTTSCYILISNLDKYYILAVENKYIWQLRKIHLAIWTNTFIKLSFYLNLLLDETTIFYIWIKDRPIWFYLNRPVQNVPKHPCMYLLFM